MAIRRYRRYLTDAEARRINEDGGGTHEFNLSIEAPEREEFWETHRHTPGEAANEHPARFGVTIDGNREVVEDGRVWDRLRENKETGDREHTESRFRSLDAPTARRLYDGKGFPPDSVVIVTRSESPDADYEYEVIRPGEPGYIALPVGEREIYDY